MRNSMTIMKPYFDLMADLKANGAVMGNEAIAAFYESAKAQGIKEGRESLIVVG